MTATARPAETDDREGPLQWLALALWTAFAALLWALMTAALLLGLPRLAESAKPPPPPPVQSLCLKGRRYVAFPEDGRTLMAMVLTLNPEEGSSVASCGDKPPADVTARDAYIVRLLEAYDFDGVPEEEFYAPVERRAPNAGDNR